MTRAAISVLPALLLACRAPAYDNASGGPALHTHASYQGASNPTGTNPLCTTGYSQANGLLCKDAGAHVRSCHIYNGSDAGAWVVLADSTAIPTTYAANTDASTGPGMVGDPFYVAANADVRIGTDFFGTDGWLTTTGFSVAMSSAAPPSNSDAGTFAAAPASFQVTCNGQ